MAGILEFLAVILEQGESGLGIIFVFLCGYVTYKTVLFDSIYKNLSKEMHSLRVEILAIKKETRTDFEGYRTEITTLKESLNTTNALLFKIAGKLDVNQ